MANRSLGSLTLDLIAKIGGFERGLDQAGRTLDKRGREMQARAKKIGTAIGVGITAGFAVATAAAFKIKDTINQMDDLSKAAQRVQLPTEKFSQLNFAASLADVSMEDLQTSLGRLTKSQALANNETSKQAKIFEALGISVKDADGQLRSSIDVLYDFADVFRVNKDSPEVMAAGLELFGRSFQNLIPLLKDGSQGLKSAADESDRLGATLSTEAGQSAEAFNDNLTRLNTVVKGFWQEVASGLVPQLEDASDRLVDVAQKGDLASNVVTVLSAAFRAGVGLIEAYNEAVARLSIQIEGYVNVVGGLQKALVDGAFSTQAFNEGINQIGQAARNEAKALDELTKPRQAKVSIVFAGEGEDPSGLFKKSAAELAAERNSAGLAGRLNAAFGPNARAGGGGRSASSGKSEAEKEAERLLQAYERLEDSQRERIDLFGQASEAAKVAYQIEQGDLKGLDATQKEVLLTNAKRIDQMEAEADLAKKLADEDKRRIESFEAVNEAIQEQLQLVTLSAEQQEIWNNLKYAGVDADSAWGRQLIESTKELQRQREQIGDQIDAMDGLRDSARGFLNDLKEGEGVWDSLKNAADSFADVLFDIVARNLIEQIFGKQGDPAGGSTGNFFSQLFGSFFGGGRASGGIAAPGMFYEVNERGFEMATVGGRDYMLTGSQPVQITPNHRLGGGGFSQTVNLNIQGPMTRQTSKQAAAEVGREARRQLARGTA